MKTEDLILKIEEIENLIDKDSSKWTYFICHSFFITTIQFIRNYIGQDSEFYSVLSEYSKKQSSGSETEKAVAAKKVLKSLKDYLKLDLEINRTEKYKIKIDIISDFMIQAIELANDTSFHPAAACILMGASLEEFLKQLAEEKKID